MEKRKKPSGSETVISITSFFADVNTETYPIWRVRRGRDKPKSGRAPQNFRRASCAIPICFSFPKSATATDIDSCQPSRNVRDTPGFLTVVPDGQKLCDCPGIWTKSHNIHRKACKYRRTIAVSISYSAKKAILPTILVIAREWTPFLHSTIFRPHRQFSFY